MNNKESIKLSIITPSYNLGNYIERTIKSVVEQDYANYEYFVIDGGSNDETVEILKKYEKLYPAKFKWISEKDKGQTDAINKGLRRATGDWFAWINADDYYEPNIFSKLVEQLKLHPDAGVVYGNCNTIHPDQKEINIPPKEVSKSSFFNGNVIFGPASFFNIKILNEVGEFDETLDLWMDYDMYMRIAKKYKLQYIDLFIANFFIREDQKSQSEKYKKKLADEAYFVSRKNGGPIFSKLLQNKYPKYKNILKYLTR
jgi:glycosyltransferase involved in cell wall biosynthesis